MSLCHYVFVRKDLSVGKMAAMVLHAAAESAVCYKGDEPFSGATAVVLEAKDEADLEGIGDYLEAHLVPCVNIREANEPYKGQLMAIGLVPVVRDTVSKLLKKFQTLKTLTEPKLDNDMWGV